MRRTKIVATVGPASASPAVLERLLRAGADAFRLNFSHGTVEEHAAVISSARSIAARLARPIAILQDLQGPKIRTGTLKDHQPVELVKGARFILTTRPIEGDVHGVSTTYAALPKDVRPGDRVLLDDGYLELQVVRTNETDVECEVKDGGTLRAKKGINLPGVSLSTPALTEKDISDVRRGLELGVDYVALSFVRRAADVDQLRTVMEAAGHEAPIIAKIEKPEALVRLPEILAQVDGIMVARGDLGVEVSLEKVPIYQKRMIAEANARGKLVITATQMLESMISNPMPTRAEVADVANAILDGTDAVMLSGETAMGKYPVEAVETMARVCVETESSLSRFYVDREPEAGVGTTFSEAAADGACEMARDVRAAWIAVFTHTGQTARLVARHRPAAGIAGLTDQESTYHRLSLLWGVTPLRIGFESKADDLLAAGEATLVSQGAVSSGETVVLVGGTTTTRGATNMVKIRRVGDEEMGVVQDSRKIRRG
ncbi:MAG: pyruvate kinase [Planctomycetes bacterium]|nr:pyruvate kinase [Planctomycetota bacterium]